MKGKLAKLIVDRIATGKKLLAVLIDPDKSDESLIGKAMSVINASSQIILVGGSLVEEQDLEDCISNIRMHSTLPICLFPGHATQVSKQADGILFLNLVSGRNPEFLIGHQVIAAPKIAKSKIEVIPTGYLLVNCGSQTAAEYMSNTQAIPYHQNGIAVATALASKFMGQKIIYMDGGSGADKCISAEMVKAVKEATKMPIIIGGGIRSKEQARVLYKAGADVLVVGNGAEERIELLSEIAELL